MKKLNAFWRYFLLALIVSLLLSSLFLIGSALTLRTLEKERLGYGRLLLEKTQTAIDARYSRILETVRQISLMSGTRRIFPLNDTSSYTLYEVGKELGQITNAGELIDNITLLFIEESIFIQSEVFSYRTSFYDHSINFQGMDYEEFISYLAITRRAPFFSFIPNSQAKPGSFPLTLIQVLPFDLNQREISGAVMVHLNPKLFFRGWEETHLIQEGGIRVFTKDGILIYSDLIVPVTDENDSFLTLDSNSELTGWRLEAVIPSDSLMKQVKSLRFLLILIVSALFLALLIVSFYAASYQATLSYKNHELREDREKHREIVGRNFLTYLVAGKLNSDEEIDDYLDYIQFDNFKNNRYHLVLLRLEGTEMNMDTGILSRVAEKSFEIIRDLNTSIDNTRCIQKVHSNLIALLYGDKGENEKVILPDALYNLAESYYNNPDYNLGITVSRPFFRLLNSPLAYIQANQLLGNRRAYSEILFAGDQQVLSGSEGFYYPIEIESHILSLIRIGESKEAAEIISEIREHNLSLSSRSFRLLKVQITGTLYKAINLLSQSNGEERLSHEIDLLADSGIPEELFSPLPDLLDRIAEKMNGGRVDSDQLLVSKTVAYLEENYSDPMLSLDMIADHFEVNKKTLSRHFKRLTGENLSSSLEQLRLTRAFTQIVETKKSIEAIAGEMGYLNYNTFHKAFKRRFHKSPGSFRSID